MPVVAGKTLRISLKLDDGRFRDLSWRTEDVLPKNAIIIINIC